MSRAPPPPEKRAEVEDLEQATRGAVDAEVGELAEDLATSDDAHPFGDNEFRIRAIAHTIDFRSVERHLPGKSKGGIQQVLSPIDSPMRSIPIGVGPIEGVGPPAMKRRPD